MAANTALRDAVFAAVRPHLARYSKDGLDKGLAFWPPPGATGRDTPAGYVTSGLEVVMSLYPEDYDDYSEFTDTGVTGILHYPVTVRSWHRTTQVMTWEAREALVEAFPLLTTRFARRTRYVPSDGAEIVETATVFIPVQT